MCKGLGKRHVKKETHEGRDMRGKRCEGRDMQGK